MVETIVCLTPGEGWSFVFASLWLDCFPNHKIARGDGNRIPARDENQMIETAHHGAPPYPDALFSASEWQAFRESDQQAAKAIVVLMAGIFCVGVLLYSIVYITL
jgi:hypothetical protein